MRYDQVGQKIGISGMKKWDELVWRSDETIDANYFRAFAFFPSLIQCDLEHCVKECVMRKLQHALVGMIYIGSPSINLLV